MTDLSPAAHVVIDAWWNASDGEYINGVWTPNRSAQLAAALQAVADQVAPENPCGHDCCITQCEQIRAELLAIAAELKAQ